MTEKIWHLKKCNLFDRLAPEELTRLETHSRAKSFARRSPIYLPNDDATSVLLLTTGRAKLCSLNADGKQAILAFIEPGELFGELAVLGLPGREEYAEAIEDSTVVQIPGAELESLMQRCPSVSLGLTRLIGLRRRRIERRLQHLLFRSSRERLVHLLLEMAEQYGAPAAGGIMLRVKLSHQDLADLIGTTRESVTIRLGELQAEGLLTAERRKIILKDVRALAASVDSAAPALAPAKGPLGSEQRP